MLNPFAKKKIDPRKEPVVGETETKLIDGISGGKAKKKPLSTRQKTVISIAVLAVVGLMVANKVMGPAKPIDADQSSGIAPIMAPRQAAPIHRAGFAHPEAPSKTTATGPLMPPTTQVVTAQPAVPYSATPTTESPQSIQNLLSSASDDTATVIQTWPGPGGLTGALYRDVNGQEGVAWVDVPENLVMIGTLVGADGKNYNTSSDFALAANRSVVAQTVSEAPTAANTISTLGTLMTDGTGFTEGRSGPQATVYIDPNSSVGHRLYLALAPKIAAGTLNVRYVPVAEKDKSSLHKAEAILAAPAPAKKMSMDERLFKKSPNGQMEGGIRGVPSTLSMVQEVDGNTALLATAGYINNPVMVYCDKAGKHQVSVGDATVGDLASILDNLGNCKAGV
ncbi:conserved protein of unknown function [Acidithiobacillus ferrivorans]|uniref:Uncharacterized protein n=2 Tax=Acidithiobacillus TaxID=119977 RepID=A0A060UKZ1_9PROT|nr:MULTISPECIES: hypothetical protein [Acidithiobacillus]MBU2815806.1 hypothetical protein [Acidithiobacillus ferruginosus]MBU2832962.1 hypothetical protein [Acidithiobacillus ferriphilus]CDQ08991.1 conserved hypothetical protein [Acidithiobacillus ferrivorans]SMH66658.1 conserved protein of unknown function [Acidithiobacillus ferrivorans]